MRSYRLICAAAVAAALCVPSLVSATEVEEQLRLMQERLDQLENRLEATSEELEASNERVEQQEQLIQSSGIADPEGASSGLSSFIEHVEFGGWVSASFWYNFNDPKNEDLIGANTGVNGQTFPFNQDSHQFSFDQLWFTMERPIDEENRAGFVAEIALGKHAKFFPLSNQADGGNSLYVPQAYVQYKTPFGPTVKAGKFLTWIGAESIKTTENWQISRAMTFQLGQPIEHTGISIEGVVGETGFDYGFALVNDVFVSQPVTNKGFAGMWRLRYTADIWSLAFNGIYGRSGGQSGDAGPDNAIFDFVFTVDPTEKLSMWVNLDYEMGKDDNNSWPSGWGVTVAGRYAVTERFGVSARAEYLHDDRKFFGFVDDTGLWGITGTVDYALTEALTVKAELRYDSGSIRYNPDDLFIRNSTNNRYGNDDQTVIGAEVIYEF